MTDTDRIEASLRTAEDALDDARLAAGRLQPAQPELRKSIYAALARVRMAHGKLRRMQAEARR